MELLHLSVNTTTEKRRPYKAGKRSNTQRLADSHIARYTIATTNWHLGISVPIGSGCPRATVTPPRFSSGPPPALSRNNLQTSSMVQHRQLPTLRTPDTITILQRALSRALLAFMSILCNFSGTTSAISRPRLGPAHPAFLAHFQSAADMLWNVCFEASSSICNCLRLFFFPSDLINQEGSHRKSTALERCRSRFRLDESSSKSVVACRFCVTKSRSEWRDSWI